MKKYLLSLLVLMSISSFTYAQFSDSIRPYPHRKLQVAMSATDFIANRVRLESSYRFDKRQAVGFGVADLFGHVALTNQIFDEGDHEISGYFLSANYKHYLYGSITNRYMFARSSVNFQHSEIAYETMEWVPFVDNGNTLFSEEMVEKDYIIDGLSLNFEIGFEVFYEVWFMEASLGASFRSVLNSDNAPPNSDSGQEFSDFDYQGIAPVAGLRIGAYLF